VPSGGARRLGGGGGEVPAAPAIAETFSLRQPPPMTWHKSWRLPAAVLTGGKPMPGGPLSREHPHPPSTVASLVRCRRPPPAARPTPPSPQPAQALLLSGRPSRRLQSHPRWRRPSLTFCCRRSGYHRCRCVGWHPWWLAAAQRRTDGHRIAPLPLSVGDRRRLGSRWLFTAASAASSAGGEGGALSPPLPQKRLPTAPQETASPLPTPPPSPLGRMSPSGSATAPHAVARAAAAAADSLLGQPPHRGASPPAVTAMSPVGGDTHRQCRRQSLPSPTPQPPPPRRPSRRSRQRWGWWRRQRRRRMSWPLSRRWRRWQLRALLVLPIRLPAAGGGGGGGAAGGRCRWDVGDPSGRKTNSERRTRFFIYK